MTKRTVVLSLVATTLLGASLACNLPSSTSSTPTMPLEETAAGMDTPVSPTSVSPTPEPKLPPVDFSEAVLEGVEAGSWSYEEGLVFALKILAAEVTEAEVAAFPEMVFGEATGLFMDADRYVQHGEDAAVRAEIERLLGIIIPDFSKLERFAVPASEESSRRWGLAAPVAQIDCADLWRSGFPLDYSASVPCFEYGSWTSPRGNTYRVFYPKEWPAGDPRRKYAQEALDALRETDQIYSGFGEMRSVNAIFMPSSFPGRSATASVRVTDKSEDRDEPCPMFFWKRATEKEIEDFKQIVAHELFHCFQWWNLLEQHVNAHPDSKWWVEGSATYFSNVAYPQNDLEHWDFLLRLDNRSLDQTIFEMSYEDYLLFQYLANRIGDDGVLDLIKSLPISPGLDAQAAAMARQASIDEYFQEFTEAFLDNKILDTSGELITVLPHPNYGPALTLRAAENLLLEGPAFQLVRYTIEFEEEQGLIIKVDSDEASGTYNAREVDAVGSWGPMPEEVGCKGTSYLIAMTSIEPGSATNRLSLAAEPGEVTCSCVVGEWVLDLPSYQVVLQSTVPPENIIVESVAGSETLKFFQDGSMVGHWDALTSRNLIRTELAGEIHLLPHEIIMDGEVNGMYFITEATGEYFVEEEGEIHYVSSVSTLQAISIIDGVELEPVEVDQADALGSSQSYTCEGDLLTLFPPIGSGAGLLFKRSGP